MKRLAELLTTNSTEHSNFILIQNGDVLNKVTLQQFFDYAHETLRFNDLALTYSNSQKGGLVASRGQVFSTVSNLIQVSYGDLLSENTIYLGIVDSVNKRSYFGNWFINSGSLSCLESSQIFNENDSTVFTGFIVSPYGEITGTEDW